MHHLEEKLGYHFHNPELLKAALYHSSYANEHKKLNISSNERMEFLGDSVLQLVSGEYVYKKHPDEPEGELSKRRSALVREESLYEAAQSLDLGDALLLGKGEETSGGRTRPSILADAMEAVFAAVYLDSSLEEVRNLICRVLLEKEGEHAIESRRRDYKTDLQEYVQRTPDCHLVYELVGESGPDHRKEFVFAVSLNGEVIGQGTGRSKKDAEQAAACDALGRLPIKK